MEKEKEEGKIKNSATYTSQERAAALLVAACSSSRNTQECQRLASK